ncbi:hypothetical protein [Cerasicoccus arenae]|uniref:Uncharacterized protein n=1 Tax=Cerasicoccus arenae TaxID=424488 RepID=A0A8J3DDL7_9BACT|nr:hypothetical protein [Cerasicoccus arenae]MBK1859648.1 hypothetical protein [Cerasicoccus arenae]GHC07458.1 hypothetical protein GCM10007047_25810 [Cerasicoccus arenae]
MSASNPEPQRRRRRDVIVEKSEETRRVHQRQRLVNGIVSLFTKLLILGIIAGGIYYFGFIFKDGIYGDKARIWASTMVNKYSSTPDSESPSSQNSPKYQSPAQTISNAIAVKDTYYRVTDKDMKAGELVDKTKLPGQKSKDYAERTDPQFFLICESDKTRTKIKFSVKESIYNNTFIGDAIPVENTTAWKRSR